MIVILGLCFLLTGWLSFGEKRRRVCLKLDVQSQEGGRILDVNGQGGVRGLENWTILMDVIRVSSLTCKTPFFVIGPFCTRHSICFNIGF